METVWYFDVKAGKKNGVKYVLTNIGLCFRFVKIFVSFYRPCAMVVPDFELICEINLIAEGFQNAKLLARKFLTLYSLCRELLSQQDHYDWGLRAIKSLLVVAGSLKVRHFTKIIMIVHLVRHSIISQKLFLLFICFFK